MHELYKALQVCTMPDFYSTISAEHNEAKTLCEVAKNYQRIPQDFENIQLPTSDLEAENPFWLVKF